MSPEVSKTGEILSKCKFKAPRAKHLLKPIEHSTTENFNIPNMQRNYRFILKSSRRQNFNFDVEEIIKQ